jgi:hypothetical protein
VRKLSAMKLDTPIQASEPSAARGLAGGTLGLVSAVLLFAAFNWAHHWNPTSVSIVSAWGFTTVLALSISVLALFTRRAGRRFAKLGVCLAGVSLLALALAGAAFAAGVTMAGGCGGG